MARIGAHLLTVLLSMLLLAAAADARTLVVAQAHPAASDAASGTEDAPFRTISRAAALAEPGDTVLVHSGIYRERVAPERGGVDGRPIVYHAAPGERVIIRASEIWCPQWRALPSQDSVYQGEIDPALFAGGSNPYRLSLRTSAPARPVAPQADGTLPQTWPDTRGQVFVDDAPYHEVRTLDECYQTPGSWITAADGNSILIHFDPSPLSPDRRAVELSVRDRVFAPYKRFLGYITVRGFVMEHAANPLPGFARDGNPQMGALSCRTGHHWVIENNTIRYAKSVGIDCGSEGRTPDPSPGTQPTALPATRPALAEGATTMPTTRRSSRPENVGFHLIRNNVVSDNGICGITGAWQKQTRIIGNVVERNNILGEMIPESGGIKVHGFVDGVIEGNLVRDNECWGIWLDAGWQGARVSRNVVLNNMSAGIFVELGVGPCLVDNNIVAFTRRGQGLYSHDASTVTWAHNLVYCNSQWGVYIRMASDRGARRGGGGASGHRVFNNLFIDNFAGAACMAFPWDKAKDNQCDYNLFTGGDQWQWTMPAAPLFMPDDCEGRVKWDTIVDAFARALDDNRVAPHDRPNLTLWRSMPLLTLDQWRLLMGNDRHSMITRIQRRGQIFQSRYMDLVLELDDAPWQMECPPVEGVNLDFLGNPMPTTRPLPGPFQNLRKTAHATAPAAPLAGNELGPAFDQPPQPTAPQGNRNRFIIWPVNIPYSKNENNELLPPDRR